MSEEELKTETSEEVEEKKPKDKKSVLKEVRDYVLLLVLAFAIAFAFNRFVIANAEVPSGSMENAVMPGDRLLVNRLAYVFGDPKRGDIVMFKFPDDETQDYLKRIIGLPGETVTIKNGLVYINDSDTPLSEPYIKDPPEGDYGPFEVPEDCYFMLGDNRNISQDARFWENKFVKRNKLVGKAFFRYFPSFGTLKSATY
jgi:signal peptidase I